MEKRTNYSLGIEAEDRAKSILQDKGFEILTSRYQVGYGLDAGEVDIIAVDKSKKLLVFVEVKKRKTLELAGNSIFQSQMDRIYNSAEIFLSKEPAFCDFDCRFDAVLFDDKFNYEYLENAWGF